MFFRYLSVTEMAALFCGGFLAATWIAVLLHRVFWRDWIHGRRNANEMIGLTLASFATIYGILLGLLAVEAYQDFSTVGDTVSKEAAALAALHHDFEGFPKPTRDELQEKLRDYAREAIDVLHPAPDKPADPHSTSPRLTALFTQVMSYQPSRKSEEAIQAEIFTRLNTLVEFRRSLILAGDDGIPSALWQVVCLGSLLFLMLMCMFDMELNAHLILSGAMALFLGSVVFLIVALDNPFSGGITVSSAPIETAVDGLMQKR